MTRTHHGAVGGWFESLVSVLPKIVDNLGKIDDALIRGIESLTGTGPQRGIPAQKAEEIARFVDEAKALINDLSSHLDEARNHLSIANDQRNALLSDWRRLQNTRLYEMEAVELLLREFGIEWPVKTITRPVSPVRVEANTSLHERAALVVPGFASKLEQARALARRLGTAPTSDSAASGDDDGDGIIGTVLKLGAGFALGRMSKRQ